MTKELTGDEQTALNQVRDAVREALTTNALLVRKAQKRVDRAEKMLQLLLTERAALEYSLTGLTQFIGYEHIQSDVERREQFNM